MVGGGVVPGVVGGVVVGVVGGVVTPPVQVTPLTVNDDGTPLVPVQAPLKPNDVVAPVATAAL
nr:hypothetical protein GCM10020092_050410 [Actinoplanes digitatis]